MEAMAVDERLERAWLYFLDKNAHSVVDFLKEAKQKGVVLPVPLHIMEKMQWGDKICCFNYMSGLVSPVWAAKWPVTKIEGLNQAVTKIIAGSFPSSACNLGGSAVNWRLCRYNTGISYKVNASMRQISDILADYLARRGDIGHPMIGCGPGVLKLLPKPYSRFPNMIEPEEALRPFNYAGAVCDLDRDREKGKNNRKGKRLSAKGLYSLEMMMDPDYSWPLNPFPEIPAANYQEMEGGVDSGIVRAALNYKEPKKVYIPP